MTTQEEKRVIRYLERLTIALERIARSCDEPKITQIPNCDIIQHVGYDEEQCGRTK